VTFQVMRRTLGTDMQGDGTMKDAQQILRHASIKTTAEIYMQEIQASVRSAINSRTRMIFGQRTNELSQLENPVSHQRKPNSSKPRNTTVPSWFAGYLQMDERMAPQVGFEPTTLRLTAGFLAHNRTYRRIPSLNRKTT
jgi:hypothetical protein